MSLSKLNPELELFDLQKSVVQFEHCSKCFKNEYPSFVGKKCNDHLKLINALVPHYQYMLTLSRRIYEIRQLNIWLLQIDEALKFGNVDEINLLVNGTPNKVNTLVVYISYLY
jgi:hypothetical protein